MNVRDFRIGWRLLLKEPGYSAAVVFGLAVGFAVCFLLLGFVRYSFTYNAAIPASDRIFVVKERRNLLPRPDWRTMAPLALRDLAVASGPNITATSAKSFDLAARIGSRVVPFPLQVADANFIDFFGIGAVEGDAAAALARPDALVLSESRARQLFGDTHAIGQRLQIDGATFEVRAIVRDLPANTTVSIDALVGVGAHSWDAAPAQSGPQWRKSAAVYVKTAPGVDERGLAALMQDAVAREIDAPFKARMGSSAPAGHLTDIGMTRLSDMYFDPDLLSGRSGAKYGSKSGVSGLAALAVLILVLASANYINLATVRTLGRQREIGIRKVIGASGPRLAAQFVAESLVVSMLATLCGLFFAWLATPVFATLVDRPLEGMFSVAACATMLALGAVVGIVSAVYPASLALGQAAGGALQGRGSSETRHGMAVRRVLSAFQFAAAIALIAITLAVSWQTRYASHADPGFDAASMLVVAIPGKLDSPGARAFRDALTRVPGVSGVAGMSDAVGRDGNKITYIVNRPGRETVPVEARIVSPEFFGVYRIGALAGRVLGPAQDGMQSTSVVINAIAAKALGFASPEAAVGQMFNDTLRIVGIVPDLRYQSLRQAPQPMVYRIGPDQTVLTARVEGSVAAARPLVEALWARHFPNDVPDIESAQSVFTATYSEDARLARILTAASVVATALASFGIYVLSAYSVKRRAREIVLRKLHGARAADVGRLIAREFAWLIGAGALAGLPVAWLATARYLAGFVERAPMGGWPLVYALACVAVVALCATARHTLAAARMSPALALRDN
ncbi:ABC transporter permease [Massilia sp. R2A-15]|uniref:ABC transporter permease n=1 Tax=Massilia sp. R2A-15 TaxID=3064278 RepID=UPI0027345AE6|nr:ABC transporter permease [Massilia sp. R2A-15]WLI91541.1 ABC transporter permease [Massilia sp. R2A-15]